MKFVMPLCAAAVLLATLGFLKPAKQEHVRAATASEVAGLTAFLKNTGLPYPAWTYYVEPRGGNNIWFDISARKPNGKSWTIANAQISNGRVIMFEVYEAIPPKNGKRIKTPADAIARFEAMFGKKRTGETYEVHVWKKDRLKQTNYSVARSGNGGHYTHAALMLEANGQFTSYQYGWR